LAHGAGISLHVLSDVEALEALGLEPDNPQLRDALANTQKAMKELIALSHDTQADLDARASGMLDNCDVFKCTLAYCCRWILSTIVL
jgi:hypothetical protein